MERNVKTDYMMFNNVNGCGVTDGDQSYPTL
jgi:lipoate-protein ligase B